MTKDENTVVRILREELCSLKQDNEELKRDLTTERLKVTDYMNIIMGDEQVEISVSYKGKVVARGDSSLKVAWWRKP